MPGPRSEVDPDATMAAPELPDAALDTDATLIAADATASREPSRRRPGRAPEAPMPERLGHYLVLRKLGAGAMGAVYAAYDTKLDRKVAIKILHARGHDEARQRLVREAQAMAKLSHPNIVQIYEIRELDPSEGAGSDDAYMVMEYVSGTTLRTWLANQGGSRAKLLEVFSAAGRGLAAAHAEGLVHRDFKPDNVMVRHDGRVLVMDFGLARGRLDPDDPSDSSGGRIQSEPSDFGALDISRASFSELSTELTATGAVMGTPAYMAPEQFHGLEADARTDQFAFCVALFEALHGQRPFAGANFYELMASVTSGQRVEPERSEVPAWIDAILARGLASDPEARWPSMDALLDALRRDPTPRKRRLLAALGLGLATTLGIGAAWVADQRAQTQARAACAAAAATIESEWNRDIRRELEQRFLATGSPIAAQVWSKVEAALTAYTREWAAMRGQACIEAELDQTLAPSTYAGVVDCLDEGRQTLAGLTEAWAELDTAKVVGASLGATRLSPLSLCRDEARLALRRSPPTEQAEAVAAIEARLLRIGGLELAGDYEHARDELDRLASEAQAIGYAPLVASIELARAAVLVPLGDYARAHAAAERALVGALAQGDDLLVFRAAAELIVLAGTQLSDIDQARRWKRIAEASLARLGLYGGALEALLLTRSGRLAFAEGKADEALEPDLRALAIVESIHGPTSTKVSSTLNGLGTLYWQLGRYDDAVRVHERALAIRSELVGADHPAVSNSLNNLGLVYWDQGKLDEAAAAHQRALDLRLRAFGPEHPDVGSSYNNLGLVQWNQGKLDLAKASFERTATIWTASLGPEHSDVGMVLNNLGLVALDQGHVDEALRQLERALAIRLAALGPEHPDVGTSYNNIGLTHARHENLDEALAAYAKAEVILLAAHGEDHPANLRTRTNIANVYLDQARYDEACEIHEQVFGITEATLGLDHPSIIDSLIGLGRCATGQGQLDEARAHFERALGLVTKLEDLPLALATVQFQFGRALFELGLPDEARAHVERARALFAEHGTAGDLAELDRWLADH